MNSTLSTDGHTIKPRTARTIRRLSVPIIVGWLAITVIVSLCVPPLERVAQERSVSMTPNEAPSIQAMKHIGKVFKESDSDNVAMIVLEGEQPLGDAAPRYYDALIRRLRDDPAHVQHIQDFWGDPLTAASSQSSDGKAAYVQIYLADFSGPYRRLKELGLITMVETAEVPA